MELTNEFTVPVPVERAWEVLTDVELIAPCLPGAQLQEVEGDEYRGVVKVKVGPITAQYKGAATFQEQDEAARRLVLKAEGRDTRGQGSASALITVNMQEEAGSTHVTVDTDLTIKGKVAQFGRGMIADVSAKLLTQFVECLEGKLDAPAGSATTDEAAPAPAPHRRRRLARSRRGAGQRRRDRRRAARGRGRPARCGRRAGGGQRRGRDHHRRRPGHAGRRRHGARLGRPQDLLAGARGGRPRRRRRRLGREALRSRGRRRARAVAPRAPALEQGRLLIADGRMADEADVAAVAELLGRAPQAEFEVVVRDQRGAPVVIRNAPLLFDGTPMPTRYWLVGEEERARIGRLESTGAIDRAEAEIGEDVIAEAHDRYAAERDADLPPGHDGPRPSGGVGGTRRGIKCFHAHWAWHLAGGDDPVGRWIERELAEGDGA